MGHFGLVIIDRIDEEFLLCALHPDGRWASSGRVHLADGVAAAWVADLLIDGKVKLEHGRLVAKRQPDGADDPLEYALGVLGRGRPMPVKSYLNRLSRGVSTHLPWIMGRLHGRGYVERAGKGRQARYPIHNAEALGALRETLRQTLTGKIAPEESTVALLTVIEGAGLLDHVFGHGAAKQGHVLLQKLLTRDHRFKTLSDAMHTPRLFRNLPW